MIVTSARLLRLLTLLQSRGFWSGAELAERLEVTQRTVRRDVDRLRTLGYPVNSSVGVAGGYQLGAGASLPPLILEDNEALAVALGLRTAAMGSVVGVEQAALRAMAKLEQVLPKRLRRRVDALYRSVAPLYAETPRIRAEVLSGLAAASRNHQQAEFRYADSSGRTTDRDTEPHGLVHTGLRWYLAAFDLDRDDWRTFRLDRIEGNVHIGSRFIPRDLPEGDAAAFVARSVSSRPHRYRARVVFHAPLARVRERAPHLARHLRKLGTDRCRYDSSADSLSRLALFVSLIGEEFEVEDPPELVDELRKLSSRVRRATAASKRPKAKRRPSSA